MRPSKIDRDFTRVMPSSPRILLIKTSSLGDVIHALPVASDIARAFPGAAIDWVVEESFAEIPPLHPAVGTIYRTALRRWRRSLFSQTTRQEIAAFRQEIQSRHYDHVIDLQGLIKSAWIARQTRGARSGFNFASAREGLASLVYDHRYGIAREQHAVLRNRQLAAAALGYSLDALPLDYGIPPLAANIAPHLQKKAGNATFALFLTATSRDDKLWREEDWIGLGNDLHARNIQARLPAGNAVERERAERIASRIPGAMVLPPSGIARLAQHFSGAALAVGVDTGLTHLACAMGIPTLAIYTVTDPGLTGVIGTGFFKNLGGKSGPPDLAEVLSATTQALA